MYKILLVEDNEMSRDMLSRRLARRGFDVSTAADGYDGIQKARSEGPDLILMDLNLPDIDGWEVTATLKKDHGTTSIPVIALTAHAMVTDKQKAIDSGCDDFATKPVEFDSLIQKINTLLERRRH